MELNVLNEQGNETAKLAASDAVFGREYNEALVHQIVVAYQANARQGTRAQFGRRADVQSFDQEAVASKGYGSCPQRYDEFSVWRGGGRAFPNTPNENFGQKVNKKMFRAAMAVIFSKLVADGRLVVVDSIGADSPKTKAFAQKLKAMGLESVMIITKEVDENLYLASRNLKNVLWWNRVMLIRFL